VTSPSRPNDWDDLAARLLAHVEAGTTDSADGSCTVRVTDYADPARWERELDVLFRCSPVVVASPPTSRRPVATAPSK
jgi:hypothetical protein